MGFKFSYVCDLLSSLDTNRIAKAASEAKRRNPDLSTVSNWFNHHERRIHDGNTDRLALLSCFFPEKRPERVFHLREPSLVKIIGRCLLLGASRKLELDRWREKGSGDLGQCVEYVMQQAENYLEGLGEVTVEEIDLALAKIASRCRFSGPGVRHQFPAAEVDETLSPIFRRLSSRDGKWFTRLILKDFNPVVIPGQLILRNFHFLLPKVLLFQNSLEGALIFLGQDAVKDFPPRPEPQYAKLLTKLALPHFTPEVGVKVGRTEFFKARNLKHCCQMAGGRVMSIEKKYDGEYCQIHINLSRPDCIQIFSKSGKDSTADKRRVHNTLKESLRIGKRDCRFSDRCIVECEILVWSDCDSRILPFHKLRTHISRSGSFIGAENDCPPDASEHLYLAFFDVLLVDDNVCLSKPYRERREILNDIIQPIEGRSELARQQTINFSHSDSYEHLKDVVAMAAAQRWEGLVLKGNDEPYFPIFEEDANMNFARWIKLKKEYIPGLGDSADFAVIGARYDSTRQQNIKNLSWTSFFVGCLEDDTTAFGVERTIFRVVDVLNCHNINQQDMETLNQLGQFRKCEPDSDTCPFAIKSDQPQMPEIEVLFRKPFVVELVGSGFERPPGVRYFTLRFPRVIKIHSDRKINDAVSFQDLQQLAESVRAVPVEELSQEAAIWTAKLDAKDGKPEYIVDDSEISTVLSSSPKSVSSKPSSFYNTLNPKRNFADKEKTPIDTQPTTSWAAPLPTIKGQNGELPGVGEPKSDATPANRRKMPVNSRPITILPDHTESTFHTEDTFRSTNDSSGFLAVLKSHSAKTNQQSDTMDDIPSDQLTIPTSPLSLSELANLENRHRTLDKNHQSSGSAVKKRILESPKPTYSEKTNNQCDRVPLKEAVRGTSQDLVVRRNPKTTIEGHSFLHQTPMLLSTGLSKGTHHLVNTFLRKLKWSSHSSIPKFLAELALLQFHDASNPISTFCHYGIVLVDHKNAHATTIASDIARVGNELANYKRQGRLPSAGKILFVQWKILHLTASSHTRSQRSLDLLGKTLFAGCLKWGYGIPARRRCRHISNIGDKPPMIIEEHSQQSNASRTDNDVTATLDWREILPLLQKSHA
ncbi:ATP-dependent DNA ligase domain-containing protein [Emydomyces testavorans]|uniref:ATP-dependent DNA ligase domain-containing protein n=1 Tax=Emydomyces testavorans TaxID=2070801 RepID=A0AAF0DCU6_9EURO|nr:ATP-dependent DNA ligase domain-containing protein [Emydomyces testavorans]